MAENIIPRQTLRTPHGTNTPEVALLRGNGCGESIRQLRGVVTRDLRTHDAPERTEYRAIFVITERALDASFRRHTRRHAEQTRARTCSCALGTVFALLI